jgi:hypothetical protein
MVKAWQFAAPEEHKRIINLCYLHFKVFELAHTNRRKSMEISGMKWEEQEH